jgi:hypothetical protein
MLGGHTVKLVYNGISSFQESNASVMLVVNVNAT